VLVVLFVVLLVAFAAGLWGTVVRSPAYEVRGVLVARPSPGMILVRHEAVAGLGMSAMEMMAVVGAPSVIDAAGVRPGDDVRLGVRRRDDDVVLIRIEKAR
jgi:Cu/Ag efflux protein CusF